MLGILTFPIFVCSNGQQDCFLIFNKNGRNKIPSFVNTSQRNLENIVSEDNPYIRIPLQQSECQGRVAVPETCGFKRLKARSASISEHNRGKRFC